MNRLLVSYLLIFAFVVISEAQYYYPYAYSYYYPRYYVYGKRQAGFGPSFDEQQQGGQSFGNQQGLPFGGPQQYGGQQ